MKISLDLYNKIKEYESAKSKPYLCPASLWTVGVGHVLYADQIKLKMVDRHNYPLLDADNRLWSINEIDELFRMDLEVFERGVDRICPCTSASQGKFDALVSFSFNLGLGRLQSSTLRMKHLRGDFEGAADEFLKWDKAGGKKLKGLTLRRNYEKGLYLQ